jgi:hypothetical protein
MTGTEIVGTLLVVLGGALLLGVGRLYGIARSSVGWTSVEGRIVTSKIDSTWDSRGAHGRSYRVLVTYDYEVAGQRFTGRRIAFGDSFLVWSRSSDRMREVQAAYQPDQTVTVWYAPARPARCALSRELPEARFRAVLGVAAVILVVGVAVLTGHVQVRGD